MKKTFKKQPGLKQARETLKHAQVIADSIASGEMAPIETINYIREFETREEMVTKLASEMLIMKKIKGEI